LSIKIIILLRDLVIFILIFILAEFACISQARPKKKIIEFSHVTSFKDVLYPDVLQRDIDKMQNKPFDGLILRMNDYNHITDFRPWSKAALKPQLESLSRINWGRFTDNFLFLYVTDKWGMNWFDDDQWEIIIKNMKLLSEVAKKSKFVGFCLDIEPYYIEPYYLGPFIYPGPDNRYASLPVTEVAAKVQQRGQQFIKALQSEMPEMKLLFFISISNFEPIFDIIDPAERERNLYIPTGSYTHRNAKYFLPWFTNLSLFYPFFLGMLKEADPRVTFIDGNENAYYYDSPEQFYRVFHTIKNRALSIIPDELKMKYKAQVQVGSSIYMNQIMGNFRGKEAIHLIPDDQPRFFEHQLYYALQTSEEYIWIYTDRPWNWWPDILPSAGKPFPEEIIQAFNSAKLKYEQGKPLGYNLTEEISAGKKRAEAATKK